MTPDCARSTRKASVSEGPNVESAVRFSKSASTSRSRSASTPDATSVPTGPIPSSRIAVYTVVPTPSRPNAVPPPKSARRQVSQVCTPAGAAARPVERASARRRSISPVVTTIGRPTTSSPIAQGITQPGRPSWFMRK